MILAEYEGLKDKHTTGREPTNAYMPRFRNVKEQETDFLRGYAVTISAKRQIVQNKSGFGEELKNGLLNPTYGPWKIRAHMMGETIPKEESQVSLDKTKVDDWGIPLLNINIDYDDNDEKMIKDFFEQFTEMFEKAGYKDIMTYDTKQAPGLDIHEMGGVRMGNDPKTSLLNKWNQLHLCKNVYVTDGACMTSTATQNPSLTFMAITARACDHVIRQFNKK